MEPSAPLRPALLIALALLVVLPAGEVQPRRLPVGTRPGGAGASLPSPVPDLPDRVDPLSPAADTLRDAPAGDTLAPIRLEGVLVDILRSPIRTGASPYAVSVLGEELGTRGRSDASIEEALHGLPGVQVQNRFNDAVGEQISIRGFGARSGFGVRGIQVVVDGIPATLPDGQSSLDHLDLGSLGRVEALRGPGAALYGNAAGGVLTFDTRSPSDSRKSARSFASCRATME
jgi:outer membrane receptor protein involved in Fe transport